MANFNLDNYETVETRLHKFWAAHPTGRILTEIEHLGINDSGQLVQVIIKASVWRDANDPNPAAVDFAEETLGSNPVNRTSFIENCSTSAIGRCLSTLGMSKIGARPSREEMTKAERVAPSKSLSQIVEEATGTKLEPKPTKAKIDALKVEAYSKAKFYKLEGAKADAFIAHLDQKESPDLIDWYAVSLMSKAEWDAGYKSWQSSN